MVSGKDAALLHTALDVERFGHATLVLNGCLHAVGKNRRAHKFALPT